TRSTVLNGPTQHNCVNESFRGAAALLRAAHGTFPYRLNASRNLIDCLRDNSTFFPFRILAIRFPEMPVSTLSTHFTLRMHFRPARKKTVGSSRSSSAAKDR